MVKRRYYAPGATIYGSSLKNTASKSAISAERRRNIDGLFV